MSKAAYIGYVGMIAFMVYGLMTQSLRSYFVLGGVLFAIFVFWRYMLWKAEQLDGGWD